MYCAIRKCEGCGCELQRAKNARRWPKWCPDCSPRKPAANKCIQCGDTCQQKYCKACGPAARAERGRLRGVAPKTHLPQCKCQQCGVLFHPKHCDRTTFCSRECSFEWKAEQKARSSERRSRRWGKRQAAAIADGFRKWAEGWAKPAWRLVGDTVPCDMCSRNVVRREGGVWLTRGKRCSECQHKVRRAQRKRTEARRAHRKRNHPCKTYETIIEEDVFCSQLWVCGICGEVVPHELQAPHPLAAEMDHIKPLSKGGEHKRSNVQCTHRICNNTKSDRTQDEAQRAIAMVRAITGLSVTELARARAAC